jgi:hypothetical protein
MNAIQEVIEECHVVVPSKEYFAFIILKRYFQKYMVGLMKLIYYPPIRAERLPPTVETVEMGMYIDDYLRNPILKIPFHRIPDFYIWKRSTQLGYDPPSWVWRVKKPQREELFERAEQFPLEDRRAFLDSMKQTYV